MIIFLYGSDRARLLIRRKELVDQFRKKHGHIDTAHFYADEDEVGACEEFLYTQSLFRTAKIAILEEMLTLDRKALREMVERASSGVDLLIVCAPKKPMKDYAFLFALPVKPESFEPLSDKEWRAFVASTAKSFGVGLDAQSLELLSLAHEGDTSWLMTELQTLRSLGKKQITKKDIEPFLPEATSEFWALVNGLKSPAIGRRLELLEEALTSRDGSAKTFHILASLWKEKIASFANYDLAVKSGKLDYEEALLDLVLS